MRRLQPEQNQDILVVLDHGRQLAGHLERRGETIPRLEAAIQSALHLAAAALLNHDRVGFLSFAGEVSSFVSPKQGRSHLSAFGTAISKCQFLPEEADYLLALRFIQARIQKRSWIAVFTDVVDEPSARSFVAASGLLKKEHRVTVFAVGDPALLLQAQAKEDHSAFYTIAAKKLLQHRKQALAAIATAGVQVVDLSQTQSSLPVVQSYLQMKSTGRL